MCGTAAAPHFCSIQASGKDSVSGFESLNPVAAADLHRTLVRIRVSACVWTFETRPNFHIRFPANGGWAGLHCVLIAIERSGIRCCMALACVLLNNVLGWCRRIAQSVCNSALYGPQVFIKLALPQMRQCVAWWHGREDVWRMEAAWYVGLCWNGTGQALVHGFLAGANDGRKCQ